MSLKDLEKGAADVSMLAPVKRSGSGVPTSFCEVCEEEDDEVCEEEDFPPTCASRPVACAFTSCLARCARWCPKRFWPDCANSAASRFLKLFAALSSVQNNTRPVSTCKNAF